MLRSGALRPTTASGRACDVQGTCIGLKWVCTERSSCIAGTSNHQRVTPTRQRFSVIVRQARPDRCRRLSRSCRPGLHVYNGYIVPWLLRVPTEECSACLEVARKVVARHGTKWMLARLAPRQASRRLTASGDSRGVPASRTPLLLLQSDLRRKICRGGGPDKTTA